MHESTLKGLLSHILHRDFLLDLEDRGRAEALKAFEMVRDRSGLDRKRARELEGQARFRMMEQGFEEVCVLHGGRLLDGGIIPSSDLKVFQPFMRFEATGRGVIFGLAAMPDRKVLPGKNKSRLAGATLNYHLTPRLDLDGEGAKIGDVFALLLVSRDKERGGLIEEIAVGVVDSRYSTLLFYEPLKEFLSGHDDTGTAQLAPPSPQASKGPGTISLKKNVIPFVPPETPKRDDSEKGQQ